MLRAASQVLRYAVAAKLGVLLALLVTEQGAGLGQIGVFLSAIASAGLANWTRWRFNIEVGQLQQVQHQMMALAGPPVRIMRLPLPGSSSGPAGPPAAKA